MSNKSGANNSAISIPKGGGSINGIGESFKPDLFTGTGNFSIPIVISRGRNDFGPKLNLQYSTGSGNGPYGLGWQISIPNITRKTEKGIPEYTDEDIFIISGAEDLVPVLDKNSNLPFYIIKENYTIYLYRPRTEGLFARIEKWVRDDGDMHWRVISKDNLTNIYGRTPSARIFDSNNARHIYKWNLQETYDAKGNHILYEYEKENPNIKIRKIYEKNRNYNQIYIRRILYGNTPDDLEKSKRVGPARIGSDGTPNGTKLRYYLYEVLFDFGDLPALPSIPYNPLEFDKLIDEWPLREDPFSSFRSGFEIRTLRRCKRILMLQHFAEEELIEAPLVKSTNFEYSINKDTNLSMLRLVKVVGYMKSNSIGYVSSEMPPVTLNYSEFKPYRQKFQSVSVNGNDFPPMALSDPNYTLIDLFGNGLPDILCTTENAYYYWRNLGDGFFERRNVQQNMPSSVTLSSPNIAIGDIGGNGLADIIVRTPEISGYYEATPIGTWKPYKKFDHIPSFDLSDSNVHLIDLVGDGLSDAIVSQETNFLWYRCLGETGYDEPRLIPRNYDLNEFPNVYFNDPEGRIRFADMNGDGLSDIVMIHNGRIDYWANLGYGRFSRRLTMANFPHFDHTFNLKRLFLVDLDGSGCDDLVYVDFNEVHFWFNQSGNKWSEKQTIHGTPYTSDVTSVQFADIFGIGSTSLVWSYNYDEQPDSNYKVLDFCGGVKPYLLIKMSNNMGTTTRVKYAPSTKFYLEDIKNGKQWVSNLPFPVQVVEKTEKIDHINKLKLVTAYKYHHGYFCGSEREFRGFGQVDQYDTEEFDVFINSSLHKDTTLYENKQKCHYTPPVLTKTWFHLGIYFDESIYSSNNQFFDKTDMMVSYRNEFFNKDKLAFNLDDHQVEKGESPHDAYRTLRGSIIRTEIYGLDDTAKDEFPYLITENLYHVKELQARKSNNKGVYFAYVKEGFIYHYERNPSDPRINHQITLGIDEYGNITDNISIIYPRRPTNDIYEEQNNIKVTYSYSKFINSDLYSLDQSSHYYIGINCETKVFEVLGINWNWSSSTYLKSDYFSAILGPDNYKPFNYISPKDISTLEKKIIDWSRQYFRKDQNPMEIDKIGYLDNRLPLGEIESLGLLYENYVACFNDNMLNDLYGEKEINPWEDGGYHPHPNHPNAEENSSGYWWIPSGRKAYNPSKFYLNELFQDSFGEFTLTLYDEYGLMVKSIETPWSYKYIEDVDRKHLTKSEPNYRVLEPQKVVDPNGNISSILFDPLGMVIATAMAGRDENGKIIGDSLSEVEYLDESKALDQVNNPLTNPMDILKNATTRIILDINRFYREGLPNVSYIMSRERYSSESQGKSSRIHHKFVYFDGFGRQLQIKQYLESEVLDDSKTIHRWFGTGTSIYNNKGKEVRKYEPFFSEHHHYGIEQHGVSPIFFYDPMDRMICNLHPNHTYEKTLIGAWKEEHWDANDNTHPEFRFNPLKPEKLPDHTFSPIDDPHVGSYFRSLPENDYLPTWYDLRMDTEKASQKWTDLNVRRIQEKAAKRTARHSATPTIFHQDGLSRNFLVIANNGKDDLGNDSFLKTWTKWDIKGNDISIIDPRNIMIYNHKFDMCGNKLLIESLDSGSKLTLLNIGRKPIYQWDSNNHIVKISYDELQRPVKKEVQYRNKTALVQKTIYGEEDPNAKKFNLIGQVYKQYDGAGLLICHKYDFKNNLINKTRKVIKNQEIENKFYDKKAPYLIVDWDLYDDDILDPQDYSSSQEFDALNRMIRKKYPDGTTVDFNYNLKNLVESTTVDGKVFIQSINYNEKDQRLQILYGNDIQTRYEYYPDTFLLKRLWTRRNKGKGKFLQDLRYFYDPIGNTLLIDDKVKTGEKKHVLERLLEHHSEYMYDPLYRLIFAKGKECILNNLENKIPKCIDHTATQIYQRKYYYDQSGNMIKLNHKAIAQGKVVENWINDYIYGNETLPLLNNKLTKIITSKGAKILSYDFNGNLKEIASNQHFYWDHADKMVGAKTSPSSNSNDASMQAQYLYDMNGIRVKKVVKCGAIIKTYVSIDGVYKEYSKKTASDVKEHKIYKHIMVGTKRTAIIKDIFKETKRDNEPSILFHHTDLLERSQILTDIEGRLFNQEEFYPFGDTSFGSYSKKRYRYNGKEYDEETGFYYFGARYYSPTLKRWISCDPLAQEEGLNAYTFVKNNPNSFRDSFGMASDRRVKQLEAAIDTGDPNIDSELLDPASQVNEIQTIVGPANPTISRSIDERIKEFDKKGIRDITNIYHKPIIKKIQNMLEEGGSGIKSWMFKGSYVVSIASYMTKKGDINHIIAVNGQTSESGGGKAKMEGAVKQLNKMFANSPSVTIANSPTGDPRYKVMEGVGGNLLRKNHAEVKIFEALQGRTDIGSKIYLTADKKMCVTCKMVKKQFENLEGHTVEVYHDSLNDDDANKFQAGCKLENFNRDKTSLEGFIGTYEYHFKHEIVGDEVVPIKTILENLYNNGLANRNFYPR